MNHPKRDTLFATATEEWVPPTHWPVASESNASKIAPSRQVTPGSAEEVQPVFYRPERQP